MGVNRNEDRHIQEFNISVPWGHIAVKTWGTEDNPHILVFHGTTDNAGSFDNLIPLLPNSFYYICIDLPGHGKSSNFPPHLPIHTTDFLIVYKLLAEYFKKEKYIILGHSYGCQIGLLFARMYPKYVEKLIGLDLVPLFCIEAKMSVKFLKERLEAIEELQDKLNIEKQPSYTYEEALELVCKNRFYDEILTREAGEPLLKRCLQLQANGRYIITTDQRLKYHINPLHGMQYRIDSLKHDPVECPTLIIFSKLTDRIRKKYKKVIDKLQTNKNVTVVYVDGRHDIHNNNPRIVAPYINKFLLSQKSKM